MFMQKDWTKKKCSNHEALNSGTVHLVLFIKNKQNLPTVFHERFNFIWGKKNSVLNETSDLT